MITVSSSNGNLIVDLTGKVIDRNIAEKAIDGGYNYLADIESFDFDEYKAYHKVTELPESIDALNLGYTLNDGRYEPPVNDWREDMKEIWKNNTTMFCFR